jgi:hypothetical protein
MQNANAQSTLRIVPHPDPSQRTYRTTKDRVNESGQITRKAGTIMHRYIVQGTPDELSRYKVARGIYYLEDTDPASPQYGMPIFTSQEQFLQPKKIVITRSGGVAIPDDEFDIRLISTLKKASKFGTGVVRHAEGKIADILFADLMRQPVTTDTVNEQPAPQQPVAESPRIDEEIPQVRVLEDED